MNKNHEKIIELQKFKDDFEGNIDIACKRIEKIEKELIRFEATEKERSNTDAARHNECATLFAPSPIQASFKFFNRPFFSYIVIKSANI